MIQVPGGEFRRGDHQGLGGLEHGNDEIPIHTVAVNPLSAGSTEIGRAGIRPPHRRPSPPRAA